MDIFVIAVWRRLAKSLSYSNFVNVNYIYLSFVQIHTVFYFNYIIYYGLLIFCCQYVASFILPTRLDYTPV